MAHTVKITAAATTYEIDCQDWVGPNAAMGTTGTTLTLKEVSRCPTLPTHFAAPITLDYNGTPNQVAAMSARQTTNTVTLTWT